MLAMGEGPVIAVDVTAEFRPPTTQQDARRARDRLSSFTRRVAVREDVPLPRLKETIIRTISIASVDAVAAARRKADVLIEPQTGVVPLLEFGQLDRMIELGRQAGQEALERALASVAG
jgi:predicted acylesterase/phospholipase RssA